MFPSQVHLWSMTLIHKGLKLKASNLHTLPDSRFFFVHRRAVCLCLVCICVLYVMSRVPIYIIYVYIYNV